MGRARRWASALAGLAVTTAVVGGCTGGEDDLEATPSESAPGRPLQTLAADGLPGDYPRDEVPVIDGEVASADRSGARDPGYAVAILTDESRSAAVADAVDLLQGAGWTARTDAGGDPPPVQILRKGQDQVIITNTVASGRTLISYAIDIS
jgi:hypothetical protein